MRRERDDWSTDDQDAFEAWLGSSLRHRIAFLELENVSMALDRLACATASRP